MTAPLLRLALGFLFLAGLAACSPNDSTPATSASNSPAGPPSGPASGPPEVPFPDLDQLESSVLEQLRSAEDELRTALADPSLAPEILAGRYGELGKLYHAYSLYDAAGACYENAAFLSPREFIWPYYLGHLRRAEGRPGEAILAFQRALEIRPDHVAALVSLARTYLVQDDPVSARPHFEQARTLDPRCAAALDGLGQLAAMDKQYPAAIDLYEQVLTLSPNASAVRYRLGMAYRSAGNLEKAQEFLEQGGAGKPKLSDPLMEELQSIKTGMRIHLNRGNEYYLAGDFPKAEAEYLKAITVDDTDPQPFTNLGSIQVLQGRPQEAMGHFETALRLDPDHQMAHFNLGTLLAKANQDLAAVAHYRCALALNPAHEEAHFNLANALRRLRQFEEALEHYQRVVAISPGKEVPRCGEIYCLVAMERYREATLAADRHFKDLSNSAIVAHIVARLRAAVPTGELRDGPRALELAQQVLDSMKRVKKVNPSHVETLAMAHAEVGQFPTAIQWQEQAIQFVAKQAGTEDRLRELRENQSRYRQNLPCVRPYGPADQNIYPPPVAAVSLPIHRCPACETAGPR